MQSYRAFLFLRNMLPKLLSVAVVGSAIFLLGGGVDFINTLLGGLSQARFLEHPKNSGLSPLAMMLYFFGFLGVLLLWMAANNWNANRKLANKQVLAGTVMMLTVYVLVELAFRIGMH